VSGADRNQVRVVRKMDNGGEGPRSERAVLAFAKVAGDQVVYEVSIEPKKSNV